MNNNIWLYDHLQLLLDLYYQLSLTKDFIFFEFAVFSELPLE